MEEETRQTALISATFLAGLGIKQPTCPGCGGSPNPELALISWPGQAFCDNEDCEALMWAPEVTAQQQIANSERVDLEREEEDR